MPSGRIRSESAASVGVMLNRGQRSSSALDNHSIEVPLGPGRHLDSGASSFTPTTPGEVSNFSFLPSPGLGRKPGSAVGVEAADPYYRPPRRTRRPTVDRDNMSSPAERTRGSWASNEWSSGRHFGPASGGPLAGDPPEAEGPTDGDVTPTADSHPPISPAPRTDYSTREVDFYYGVRGRRLNSGAPNRKLGTGPADPTSPISSAAGWFRGFLGGKSKEKGKGFEVVRSSRMPPAMRVRGNDPGDETPPEGIPVAMDVIRNGPIESDDEDETHRKEVAWGNRARGGGVELLDAEGNPRDEALDDGGGSRVSEAPPMLPGIDAGGSIQLPSRIQSKASRHEPRREEGDDSSFEVLSPVPNLPRKSSRRHSGAPSPNRVPVMRLAAPQESPTSHGQQHLTPSGGSARLPFERSNSQNRPSSDSSAGRDSLNQVDLQDTPPPPGRAHEERPTSFGYVHQGSISRIDPDYRRHVDFQGTSAEVVDARR